MPDATARDVANRQPIGVLEPEATICLHGQIVPIRGRWLLQRWG